MVKGWECLREVLGSSSNGNKNLPIKKEKRIKRMNINHPIVDLSVDSP